MHGVHASINSVNIRLGICNSSASISFVTMLTILQQYYNIDYYKCIERCSRISSTILVLGKYNTLYFTSTLSQKKFSINATRSLFVYLLMSANST